MQSSDETLIISITPKSYRACNTSRSLPATLREELVAAFKADTTLGALLRFEPAEPESCILAMLGPQGKIFMEIAGGVPHNRKSKN